MGVFRDFVRSPLTAVNPFASASKKATEWAGDRLLPRPPEDPAGEFLREQEERRQQQIREGTQRVNDAFARFDEPYYEGIAKAYLDYYRPLLTEQFNEAKRSLTLASPTAGSSAFARSMGLLARDYARENVSLSDRAQQDAAEERSRIEDQRSSLLSSVRAGAGVDEAGMMAARRTQADKPIRAYSPLGDVFQRFGNMYANAGRAQRAGFESSPLLFGSSGSNVRTVR